MGPMPPQLMHSFVPRVSSSSNPRRVRGLTLIELLVTLVILSILASAALPYAELTIRRDKELALHRALREVRTAIDTFHEDWLDGRIPRNDRTASADGYPRTLEVLVDGVDTGRVGGGKRRYLRRVPRDPFADPRINAEQQWALRGYQDGPDANTWNGEDVYDIHSRSVGIAIDGTRYRDW